MTKVDQRTPISRELIVETAHALLQRFGARKLKLADVARELGVSHAALYRHFASKDDLDTAIVTDWIKESTARIDRAEAEVAEPAARLERILVEMHMTKKRKIAADPEVYTLYLTVLKNNPPVLQEYAARIRGAVFHALQEWIGPGDPRLPEAAQVLENAIFRFLHPVHTLEALNEDTETQLKAVVAAVLRAYSQGTTGK